MQKKISTFHKVRKAFWLTDKEGPDKKVVNRSKFYQFFILSVLREGIWPKGNNFYLPECPKYLLLTLPFAPRYR